MGRPSSPQLRGNLMPVLGWIVLIVVAAVVPYTVAQLTSGGGDSTPVAVPAPVEPSAAPSTVAASPATSAASTGPGTVTATPITSPVSVPASSGSTGSSGSAAAASGAGITGSSDGGGAVAASPDARTYVVKPGDSIWSITAHDLGATADRDTVQSAWPRIYAANRAVIGANPNIVRPGEVLTLTS